MRTNNTKSHHTLDPDSFVLDRVSGYSGYMVLRDGQDHLRFIHLITRSSRGEAGDHSHHTLDLAPSVFDRVSGYSG